MPTKRHPFPHPQKQKKPWFHALTQNQGFKSGRNFSLDAMPLSLADSLIPSAFPWVAAHLDLHSSRVFTFSSLREYEQGEFLLQGVETLGQHPRTGDPGRDPKIPDQHQRVAEADSNRLDLGAFGDTLHFESDEVVSDGQSPEFLKDLPGRSAA